METQGQNLSGKLNHLIALAEDGKYGYENASKDVKNTGMQALFQRFANERSQYVAELQAEVAKLGENAKDMGGPVGVLHRTWMDIKSVFTGGDKDAMIKECIAGDEYALDEYKKVIEKIGSVGVVQQIIAKQKQGIENALLTLKAYKVSE